MSFIFKLKNKFDGDEIKTILVKDIKFSFLEYYPKDYKKNKKYDWNKLEYSLKEKGYNPSEFSFISISKDNFCVDGHHRLVILKKLKPDLLIEVKKIRFNYWIIILVYILLSWTLKKRSVKY